MNSLKPGSGADYLVPPPAARLPGNRVGVPAGDEIAFGRGPSSGPLSRPQWGGLLTVCLRFGNSIKQTFGGSIGSSQNGRLDPSGSFPPAFGTARRHVAGMRRIEHQQEFGRWSEPAKLAVRPTLSQTVGKRMTTLRVRPRSHAPPQGKRTRLSRGHLVWDCATSNFGAGAAG